MRWFQRHKHEYKQSGITLWCTCGSIKNITCGHKWKLEQHTPITMQTIGGVSDQDIRRYSCTICGGSFIVNDTTGRIIKQANE